MALDPRLLEILACPDDKGPLLYFPDEDSLYNPRLHRRYLVEDDIPNMLKFVPSGTSSMDFVHYQSPKLLGSSPLSQINNNHNQENLGQTSGAYPIYLQNLGWSEKSKIPIVWDFPNI